MKYKVIMGSVRTDRGEVKEGSLVELSDNDGKLLMANGVVEEIKEESKKEKKAKAKAEKEAKAKAEKAEKEADKKAEEEVEEAPKPSIDWTRKELNEYANAIGIKDVEKFEFKKQVLKAIAKEEK